MMRTNAIIRVRLPAVPNVSEYSEAVRGGAWDRQVYTGSPDAALAAVRERSASMDRTGQRPLLRSHDQLPSWIGARPQWWYDSWRHAWRLLRYLGDCVSCGRRTYAFDDGENDPRGALGDHAASPITSEDTTNLRGAEYVPACFLCMNDYDRYHRALNIAHNATR